MRRLTVLERGRLVRGDTDDWGECREGTPSYRLLPRRVYDRLERYELTQVDEEGEKRIVDWRERHGIVGPWVGLIQTPGLQLEILPKTDGGEVPPDEEKRDHYIRGTRDNLLVMLARGGIASVRARGTADLSVQRGSIHDRLVESFLERTIVELLRGHDRTYVAEEANLLAVRGKLLISRQLTTNAAQRHRFYCRHDVLTEATQISIRLKQACRTLLWRGMPTSEVAKVQTALALLDDVPDVAYRPGEPDPVFHRQNERFVEIYRFACMLLERQAADVRRGDVSTFSLLFNMDQVFERFIAAFLKEQVVPQEFPGAFVRPQGQGDQRNLFIDAGPNQSAVLSLKPDILVEYNGQTIIIDTKWKRLPAGKPSRPSNDDFYQLYAYLQRYDCQHVFLLYPYAGAHERTFTALQGASKDEKGSVGVRFVGLAGRLATPQGREELAKELAAILHEGFDTKDQSDQKKAS